MTGDCQTRSACTIIATRVVAQCVVAAAQYIHHSTSTFKNIRRSRSCRNGRRPEKNENQLRKNEGHAEIKKTFAPFVSWWLILGGKHMRSLTIGRALALTIALTIAM